MTSATLPIAYSDDVETLWDYNQMHHSLRPVDIALGLGSHDLGVATYAAELYHRGLCPRIIFSGANAPTTIAQFPRGEAVHYRERALALGVPDAAIIIEPNATNTGENIDFSRAVIQDRGLNINSVMIVSRPYQQRRAYAMARLRWSDVDVICASQEIALADYVYQIGDAKRVIDMIVGDTQRIWVYAEKGLAIPQIVPNVVHTAFERLAMAGFTSRLI